MGVRQMPGTIVTTVRNHAIAEHHARGTIARSGASSSRGYNTPARFREIVLVQVGPIREKENNVFDSMSACFLYGKIQVMMLSSRHDTYL